MFKDWFQVVVKYYKNSDEEESKNVSENFLFDAVSWTEAEVRVAEEMKKISKEGFFQIKNIKKTKLTEVFAYDSGDWWFKVGVDMIVLDEDKGKEKKTRLNYLVMADDLQEALDRINLVLEDSISDYQIEALNRSSIVEVFPYVENLEKINSDLLKEVEGYEFKVDKNE